MSSVVGAIFRRKAEKQYRGGLRLSRAGGQSLLPMLPETRHRISVNRILASPLYGQKTLKSLLFKGEVHHG
jgi:hypothetical protein